MSMSGQPRKYGARVEMRILIKTGPGEGRIIQSDRSRIAIGRSRDSDISLLGDLLASRRHCEILRRGWNWTVVDMGSTNGTLVNGAPISRPTVLHHGDVIRVGACELVALSDAEDALPGRESTNLNGRPLQRLRGIRAAAATVSLH